MIEHGSIYFHSNMWCHKGSPKSSANRLNFSRFKPVNFWDISLCWLHFSNLAWGSMWRWQRQGDIYCGRLWIRCRGICHSFECKSRPNDGDADWNFRNPDNQLAIFSIQPIDSQDCNAPVFQMDPNTELVLTPICEAFDFHGSCAQMQSLERAFRQDNVIGIS